MGLTVGQLRKALKGLPADMEVYTADHDHSDYEWNSPAGSATVVDKSEMDEGDYLDDSFKSTPNKYLVIRP